MDLFQLLYLFWDTLTYHGEKQAFTENYYVEIFPTWLQTILLVLELLFIESVK